MWVKRFKDSKGLVIFDLWLKLWHLWTVKKIIQHYFENPYFGISLKRELFFTQRNGQKSPKIVFFGFLF